MAWPCVKDREAWEAEKAVAKLNGEGVEEEEEGEGGDVDDRASTSGGGGDEASTSGAGDVNSESRIAALPALPSFMLQPPPPPVGLRLQDVLARDKARVSLKLTGEAAP